MVIDEDTFYSFRAEYLAARKCVTHPLCPKPRRSCAPTPLIRNKQAHDKGRLVGLSHKPAFQIGGRHWVRTSDLFRVREARYRCASRPRWRRDLNPCIRICSPLPRLSATPPREGLPHHEGFRAIGWGSASPSGRRDSNPRPSPWQGDALPTEPRPHAIFGANPKKRVGNDSGDEPSGQVRPSPGHASDQFMGHFMLCVPLPCTKPHCEKLPIGTKPPVGPGLSQHATVR